MSERGRPSHSGERAQCRIWLRSLTTRQQVSWKRCGMPACSSALRGWQRSTRTRDLSGLSPESCQVLGRSGLRSFPLPMTETPCGLILDQEPTLAKQTCLCDSPIEPFQPQLVVALHPAHQPREHHRKGTRRAACRPGPNVPEDPSSSYSGWQVRGRVELFHQGAIARELRHRRPMRRCRIVRYEQVTETYRGREL